MADHHVLLDDFTRLNDPPARREIERRGSFFVVEGELVLRTLLECRSRWPLRSVVVTPPRRAALADVLDRLEEDGVPVLVQPLDRLRAITGFDVHRGVLASAERGEPLTVEDALASDPILVVHGVNDHENLGALFRNAAAFGCGGVVLDRHTADPLYRRSVRVSLGHVLRVPFARADGFDELRTAGYSVVALTPHGESTVDEIAAAPSGIKVAVVVGAEGPGLPAVALRAADSRVRIPMAAGVDSINVATAAAIVLHHLHRRLR